MSKIAKKSRTVNRGKRQKEVKQPPRYTIRKDSLGRRYAIDKRNGKRVSVSKAEKEQIRRRKTLITAVKPKVIFHRIEPIKPQKTPRRPSQRKKRSEAAKKGWETRRAKIAPLKIALGWHSHPTYILSPLEPTLQLPDTSGRVPITDIMHQGIFAIPEGIRLVEAGGIADRAEIYPKVKVAANNALEDNQLRLLTRRAATREGRPLLHTPTRFDRLYRTDLIQAYQDHLGMAGDLIDVDQKIKELEERPDNDMSLRELYTLYFSPDVV